MKALRIVIVTYDWPSRNSIGTHRPYAWARYWSAAGAEVTVLTARKQWYDEPLDLQLPVLPGVLVKEVDYRRVVRAPAALLRSAAIHRAAKWLKARFSRVFGTPVDVRCAWWTAARVVAREMAATCDIVVSTYGPSAAHLIAYDMKRENPTLRWVADYRDLWSQSHLIEISTRARNTCRKEELATVGAAADLITTVSHDLACSLTELTGKPVHYVPNGFDVDEQQVIQTLAEVAHTRRRSCDVFRIVYTGIIYKGWRDPSPLLDALAALKESEALANCEVTIEFYGSRADYAHELANNPKYSPFIRIMGHKPRVEALAAQRSADLLLLLESAAPEARGVLTGKLFEYLVAGRPILCVGSCPNYEIGTVLRTTGTGAVFGPAQYPELAAAIAQTLQGAGLFSDFKPRIDEILKYSRKRLAMQMMCLITPTPSSLAGVGG